MENYFYISRLCLIALLVLGCFAEDPLKVTFESTEDTMYVNPGDENIQFTCIVNRDIFFATQNPIEILYRNPITNAETVMAKGAILQEAAAPVYYNAIVDRETSAATNEFHIVFTIKKVRDNDDGAYVCNATDTSLKFEASAEVQVVVVRPLTEIKLQFDDLEPISQRPEEPIEVKSGAYEVKCMAYGANPGTENVKLYLDGVPVESGIVSIEPSDGSVRSFVSTISAMVDISAQTSGKDLQCVAKTKNEDVTKTVELGISVKTYDPHVLCNDSQAFEGQMHPVLVCIVNHTDIAVNAFAFEIGKTGEIIEKGVDNENKMQVTTEQLSQDITQVSLNLHKAKDWHFEEDFYIIIRSQGGHTTKERVVLEKLVRQTTPKPADGGDIEDDNDAANSFHGSMAVFISVGILLIAQLL